MTAHRLFTETECLGNVMVLGIEYRIFRSQGEVRWIESRSFIAFKPDGTPLRALGVNLDITDRWRAEDHQRQLIAELDHRVKNVLATVGAIVTRTQWNIGSPADFVAAVDRRIQSMARIHELLSQSHSVVPSIAAGRCGDRRP